MNLSSTVIVFGPKKPDGAAALKLANQRGLQTSPSRVSQSGLC